MEVKPCAEPAERTQPRRPASVVVAQCLIALVCVVLLVGTARAPFRWPSLVLLIVVAGLVALAVALSRRRRFARWIALAFAVLSLGNAALSQGAHAAWSAFFSGASSTHLPAPFMNFANRTEMVGGMIANLVMIVAFAWLAASLAFSRRVRAWFAPRAE